MDPQQDTIYIDFSKGLYRINPGSQMPGNVMQQLLSDPEANLAASVTWPAEQLASGVDTTITQSATGSFQQGKKTFDNTASGFILGVDPKSGTAKFYIGNTTNYMNWDGSTLTITGTVNALSGYFGNATNGILINSSGIQIVGTGYLETAASPNERIVIEHNGTFGNQITMYDSSNRNTAVYWANGSNAIQFFQHGGQSIQVTQFSAGTVANMYIEDQLSTGAGYHWQGPSSGSSNAARQRIGAFSYLNQNCAHGEGLYMKNLDTTWDGNFIRFQGSTGYKTNLLYMDETGWSAVMSGRITQEGYVAFPAFSHRSEFDEGNAALAASVVAKAYWTGSGVNGTQTINPGVFSSDGWTYLYLDTTAAANSTCQILFNQFLQTLNESFMEMMIKFNHTTNMKAEWGWKYDATHYMFFRFDTAVHASNIYFVWNNGAGESTQATGQTIDSTFFYIWRLWIYPGSVVYGETESAGGIVTLTMGVPSITSLAKPYFYIDNKASAVSNTMAIDYVHIFTGRNLAP